MTTATINVPALPDEIPPDLMRLLEQLKVHRNVKWEAEDYEEGDDGREEAPSLREAEAASSLLVRPPGDPLFDDLDEPPGPRHALLIDVDVPAWLLPSSTPGHSHLFVDLSCSEEDLFQFLRAAAQIGLVEEGYANACESRGATSLRLPWVRKGDEQPLGHAEPVVTETTEAPAPPAVQTWHHTRKGRITGRSRGFDGSGEWLNVELVGDHPAGVDGEVITVRTSMVTPIEGATA